MANASRRVRIGVDLGGTKIEAVAMDPEGRLQVRKRIASPRDDYRATIEAIANLVGDVAREAGAERDATVVGAGTPGSISPRSGLLRNANSVWLNNQPLEADLAAALDLPLRMANDANCFAMSEAADGAAAGAASVFGVIIGTGVGGGLVLNGRLIGGAHGVAGEWGHTPLPSPDEAERPGRPCWCGRRNCIETWLSGVAFERDYAGADESGPRAPEIVSRAASGEAAALGALDRYIDRLGRALGVIVNIFDPEVVVLGGGMSNVDRLYADLPAATRPHVFSDHFETRIVKNVHGDSSGVRGAAWLWPARSEDD